MSEPIIKAKMLAKTYDDGAGVVHVLRDISLTINKGECVAIVGASGSGKSTLLHLLGGLDTPTSGHALIDGQDIHALSESKRCQLRNKSMGFIYQFHHLLREFTALENVMMPLLIAGKSLSFAKQEAKDLLEEVGLGPRLLHKVGELSGGERQRCAIARALVTRPACVLADEPTGNLDPQTAEHVYQVMLSLQKSIQTSFVIVTHDLTLAHQTERVYMLSNGSIETSSSSIS
jgi:lipoprotein-releasing system ATP-binding protein